MGSSQPQVRREAQRFVVSSEGKDAGFAEFKDTPGHREFHHTVIDSAFQGRGMSKPLIREALDATRTEGLKVLPSCSAVAGFIEKNEDYRDLLAD